MSQRDLLSAFGRAVGERNASIFVGAGLSQAAGFPGWAELLAGPRGTANIPDEVRDLALAAQYYVQAVPGGVETLKDHVLKLLAKVLVSPTTAHRHLADVPVDDVWTTNYDCLLEATMPDATVLASENDVRQRRSQGRKRVIKIHGSLTPQTPVRWLAPPIITREHYESYERAYPRLWALLRATYLTKSMLFLGFSFTDPNIEVLLRLSRTLQTSREHFTVLRRPEEPGELRLHELRRDDLEQSGVQVCEIDDYAELEPMLQRLARRTTEPMLFVSGSFLPGDSTGPALAHEVGVDLADLDLSVASLGGTAALAVSFAFGRALQAKERYAADRVRIFFRSKQGEPPLALPERIGTIIHTSLEKERMREKVLNECRALLLLGGGTNTAAEVELAQGFALPIVPVARSGGAAHDTWKRLTVEESGINSDADEADRRDWKLLAHDDLSLCAKAVQRLVLKAMYLPPHPGALT